jgi:hypothetical protein
LLGFLDQICKTSQFVEVLVDTNDGIKEATLTRIKAPDFFIGSFFRPRYL